jgi:hypothetical protein
MARFYSNENFPLPAVEELRNSGHDVLTSYESSKADQAIADEAVLAFAIAEDRILLTLNRRHFIRLHRLNSKHSGIIVCTVDADYAALAGRIHSAVQETPEMKGQLIRVNHPG